MSEQPARLSEASDESGSAPAPPVGSERLAQAADLVDAPRYGRLRRSGPQHAVQVAQVARRFYLLGHSKQDIARELGMSRFKVARLLQEARETGVVRIEIAAPALVDEELSDSLARAYGLHHALVLDVPDEPESEMRRHLARVTADLLSEIVTDDDVLGIGYGRTLSETTAALTRLARCTTVQLAGALLGVHTEETSIELVRRVARLSGGPVYPLYTPQILPDEAVAEALRAQQSVAEAYALYHRLTKAVVAVGSWNPVHSLLYEALPDDVREDLRRRGAVAEMCTTLVDLDGQDVAPELTERCISIRGQQLRETAEVIAVAGGVYKIDAITGVLRGGYAHSLITNASVARGLLDRAPPSPDVG